MANQRQLNYFAAMADEPWPIGSQHADQHPTREAYEALQAHLEAVLNALPDRLYEVDALGNVYGFWAPGGAPMLLVPPEKLVGHHMTEFLPADVCEATLAAVKIACEKGKHRGTSVATETIKGRMWFELSIAVKRPFTGGAEQRLLVLVQDITERKESEAALSRSVARYRAIFETTGTATVIYDNDGLITLSNDEFSKLTGYPKEQVDGKLYWMDVIDPTLVPRQLQYHNARQTDPSNAPRRYETRVIGAGGKIHEGVLTIEMIPGTTERVASFLDLSDLKQAEHQMFRAEKMASLGQIVAGVTHEINNPNNFIYFNLPILRRYVATLREHMDRLADEQANFTLLSMPYAQFMADLDKLLDNMEHGSKRITAIVEELKHYVRGNEEEKRIERIETIVNRAMTLVGKQVRKMVRHLDIDISAGLPPILMDPGKIEQVIVNLLINAAQAADKSESWVKLSVAPHERRPNVICVVVSDNGMGIPNENIHRIFEPFFTSKGRDTGTGLGLSICQRIIDEHGGRIAVASTPGEGACFTVELPASST